MNKKDAKETVDILMDIDLDEPRFPNNALLVVAIGNAIARDIKLGKGKRICVVCERCRGVTMGTESKPPKKCQCCGMKFKELRRFKGG